MIYCKNIVVDKALMKLFTDAVDLLPEEFVKSATPFVEEDIYFLLFSNLPINWEAKYNLVFHYTEQ